MNRKGLLYLLLVLGIVVVGGGIWLMYDSTTQDTPETTQAAEVNIPEGAPVIYEQVRYLMGGENRQLYIYENGSILYIEEKGLRVPSAENPATRSWRTGNFTVDEVNNLLFYLKNSGLDKLEDSYTFQEDVEGGALTRSDMNFTIIVNGADLNKQVTTSGYLSTDQGETYPDMPSPLNDIYVMLRNISKNTVEAVSENME
ncbi:MAG: hypothetical protein JXA46_05255 [Dehalococcoidales bacterium]|nr:hypothetical protein [Dehalococcoidales bacterium]